MVIFDDIALRTPTGNMKRPEWLRRVARVRGEQDCIIWPFAVGKGGYGNVRFNRVYTNAHRVVCVLAHGEPPEIDMQAAHECGNRLCVNPEHLSWKTRKENDRDKIRHGTHRMGERNNLAKHSLETVLAVRALKDAHPHLTLDQMQEITGVHRGTIWGMLVRKNWDDRKVPLDEMKARA